MIAEVLATVAMLRWLPSAPRWSRVGNADHPTDSTAPDARGQPQARG